LIFQYLEVRFNMKNNKINPSKKKDFQRIIIPVDGSQNSKRAAKKAIDLAKGSDIEVLALYVVQEPDSVYPQFIGMYPDAIEMLKREGHGYLNDIKKMGSDLGVTVKTKLFVGFPEEEIIKEAGKNDLIVIGCKGHSALGRIFIGSICEKVLHHSSSPVMIIR
jgi:nucleotide-binding universal stress UspA family protein